jgi:hypothetical protein
MNTRYITSTGVARCITAGTVLYHGGTVVSVSREADGTIIITTAQGARAYAPTARVRYYPYL